MMKNIVTFILYPFLPIYGIIFSVAYFIIGLQNFYNPEINVFWILLVFYRLNFSP